MAWILQIIEEYPNQERGATMKTKNLFAIVIVLALSMFIASVALAECPEGKSEVILVTPSGKIKTICVPETALPGIENAAEHSAGNIVPASCPCLTVEEIQKLEDCSLQNGVPITCVDDGTVVTCTCLCEGCPNSAPFLTIDTYYQMVVNECGGGCRAGFNEEEYDACMALIKAYMACPCFSLIEVVAADNEAQLTCQQYTGETDPSGYKCVFTECYNKTRHFGVVYSPGDETCLLKDLPVTCPNACSSDWSWLCSSEEEASECYSILKQFMESQGPVEPALTP
jgi:hypothetical protein